MDNTPWRRIFESAVFMGLIFFFVLELVDIYVPLALGRRLVLYEDNRVVAFFECVAIVAVIAFLIYEYAGVLSREAAA